MTKTQQRQRCFGLILNLIHDDDDDDDNDNDDDEVDDDINEFSDVKLWWRSHLRSLMMMTMMMMMISNKDKSRFDNFDDVDNVVHGYLSCVRLGRGTSSRLLYLKTWENNIQ